MPINKRNAPGGKVQDPSTIANATYNEQSGAQKNMEVGRHLLALPDGSGGYTTNATTARKLLMGKCLAVFNNSATVAAVTLGDDTYPPTAQAAGVVQASTAGRNIGIPCTPNDWTYIAMNDQNQVIASAATLLVFVIDDYSTIQQEASR